MGSPGYFPSAAINADRYPICPHWVHIVHRIIATVYSIAVVRPEASVKLTMLP